MGSPAMGSPALGVVRLIVYLIWTALILPVQGVAVMLRLEVRRWLPLLYHRGILWIFDLKVEVIGTCSRKRPTLFISNHVSYLDIEVLGSLIAGSFVAKSEVAGWPVFGALAKLQETVFINRKFRHDVKRQGETMLGRLVAGDSLILFPEGTSSDGNRVLPFKTALFSVAAQLIDNQPLVVQPISLTAVALDGMPLGRSLRPLYAWYGDMFLGPHLWQIAKIGGITIVVQFHAPVSIDTVGSRKEMSDHCFRMIRDGVAHAVSGSSATQISTSKANN